MDFIQPMPFDDAIGKLDEQTIVASSLSSSEWADVPLELRDNAFFSSRIESARFLQRAKDALGDFVTGSRVVTEDGQTMLATGSRAAFVDQMQKFLADEGVVRAGGGLQDITSEKRLGLIFDVKTRQAQDYGYWKQGMNPLVLNEFPAQRFIRVREVKTEREGHVPFQDQVYLKTDPIWTLEINRDFGVPWGPWGWGCGHDVEDVDRTEAEKLRLLKPGQRLAPLQRSLNNNLQASIARLDPDLIEKLQQVFGRKVVIEGDTMRWAGGMVPAADLAPAPVRQSPVSDAITPQVFGALKRQVDQALAAIDRVHDDGVLPPIPVFDSLGTADFGFLQPVKTDRGLEAEYIAVRASGPWPALTAVHEIGHFLDIAALGPVGRLATRAGDPEMLKVLAAAEQTDAVKSLREQADQAGFAEHGFLLYLLRPDEIWARAYAQFIAERSNSPLLLKGLRRAQAENSDRQWDTEDFAPVAQAIENMFAKLGWL